MAETLGSAASKSTLGDRMQNEAGTMDFLPPVNPAQAARQAAFEASVTGKTKRLPLDDLSDLPSEEG